MPLVPETKPTAAPLDPPLCPTLVLDSNVVLDWLVFREPATVALAEALQQRRVRWIATVAMRDELEHVLSLGRLDAWAPDGRAIASAWDTLAHMRHSPPPLPPSGLRCTDPDDQKFIDLALHENADALLSHDRAVLHLAKRAHSRGLSILTPNAWLQQMPALCG